MAGIKVMLQQQEDIDSTQTLIFNFNQFSASSLDITVYAITKTTVWVTFHAGKQDVLLKVGQIIEQHGEEIALLTQPLQVARGAAGVAGEGEAG